MLNVTLILIIGFVLLVKGADFFVDGSSQIARFFKIPSLIIGLTIVAMGTSAPETAVSISAALKSSTDIAIANVVGSNIFNILVVVGLSAFIKPLKADTSMIKKEIPFSIITGIILFVMSFDSIFGAGKNILSRSDGILLLMIFAMFMYSLLTFALANKIETEENVNISLPKSLFFSIFGLIFIIIGGKMVVNASVTAALSLGISENLIGLTIVAIGTSLPELATSIVAARKGESDIALGNAVGSNIFNILFVLGASALISPLPVNPVAFYDIIILFVISLLVYAFAFSGRRISKKEGLIMVLTYVSYLIYIIIR